jgi:hypothetical protein
VADAAGILARGADRAANRIRVLLVDQLKAHDVCGFDLAVLFVVSLFVLVQAQDWSPVAFAALIAREGLIDVENARKVFGPLRIARQPETVLGEP